MQRAARQFVIKAISLALLFYAISYAGSVLFDRAVNWRKLQDPRARLLWDPYADQAEIVILGDSVFISAYVNSAEESLPRLLEAGTGKRVFNGALDGGDCADFVNGARLLQNNGLKNATVILDIIPVRFLQRRHPERLEGNYPGDFTKLIGNNPIASGFVTLRKPLLILNPDIVINSVRRRNWYSAGDFRDRVWNRDPDFARNRFKKFEEEIVISDKLRSFDSIREVKDVLKQGHNQLVVFLTPVNHELVREYSTLRDSTEYERLFSRSRSALLNYLEQKNIQHIDGTDKFDSQDFADMIHFNARGERRAADLIKNYTSESGAGGNGGP
jgi:hypothetical protein